MAADAGHDAEPVWAVSGMGWDSGGPSGEDHMVDVATTTAAPGLPSSSLLGRGHPGSARNIVVLYAGNHHNYVITF